MNLHLWVSSYWQLKFRNLLVCQNFRCLIFSSTEWAKQSNKENKPIITPPLFKLFQQKWNSCFWFFTENVHFLLHETCCAGPNNNLSLDRNSWKLTRLIIVIANRFWKEYAVSFLMKFILIDLVPIVHYLLIFKVCEIMGISKIKFFNFFLNESVEQNKQIKNQWKQFNLVTKSFLKQFQK